MHQHLTLHPTDTDPPVVARMGGTGRDIPIVDFGDVQISLGKLTDPGGAIRATIAALTALAVECEQAAVRAS